MNGRSPTLPVLPAAWTPWLIAAAVVAVTLLIKPRFLRTLLSHLENGAHQIALFCQRSAERMLALRPHATERESREKAGGTGKDEGEEQRASAAATEAEWTPWLGFVLFARLLWGNLCALLLLAQYSLDSGKSCVVQFGDGDCTVPIPISITQANGVLWFVVICFFGGLFAEGIGWVETHLHLFPNLGPGPRRWLTIYGAVGIGLSMVAVTLLYVVGQMALMHMTWPLAVLVISAIQGALVNGAGIPAAAGLIYGVGAVLALVCSIGWLVFAVLHRLFMLLGHLLARREGVPVIGRPPIIREEPVVDSARSIYLLAVGREPTPFQQMELRPAVTQYEGDGAMAGTGSVDPHRLDRAPMSPAGPLDLCPTKAHVQSAHQLRGNAREQSVLVIDRMFQNAADRATAYAQTKGHLLIGLEVESVPLASQPMTSFARAKNGHTLIGMLHLPMPGAVDPLELAESARELERLHRERVLACVIPLDPRSPFTRSGEGGVTGQDRYVGHALGQTICAHVQDDTQPSLGELMAQMGRRYPYCGLATKSVSIPVGKKLWWWAPFEKAFRLGVRGYSDPGVISNRALDLVQQLIEDPSLRCVDAPIDVNSSPLFVTLTAPLQAKDRVRWQRLRDDFEVGLTRLLPNATALFVRGQGVQDRRIPDPFYLQLSLFYGVERLPGIEEVDETPPLLQLPPPQAGNGAQPAQKSRRRAASRVQSI